MRAPVLRERPAAHRGRDPGGEACGCDLRCQCGSLMARVVDGVVELKCRRCKRTFVLPLSAPEAG